jgi:hypothetical protein
VFFSDAVVAIAITLLAIELPVPEGDSTASLLDSLGANSIAYLTFLISFLVIGAHWRSHHQVFRYRCWARGPSRCGRWSRTCRSSWVRCGGGSRVQLRPECRCAVA